jgi:hypothetical protein
MRNRTRLLLSVAAGAAGFLFLPGCLSTHPGSSSMAYVDVDATDADAIRAQAVRVFEDEGYAVAAESAGGLVFEREGTQRDQVMYGRYGARLTMRVVVLLESRPKGGYLVRADAYVVHDGSAEKLLRMARRPYQKLLCRVKASVAEAGSAGRLAP